MSRDQGNNLVSRPPTNLKGRTPDERCKEATWATAKIRSEDAAQLRLWEHSTGVDASIVAGVFAALGKEALFDTPGHDPVKVLWMAINGDGEAYDRRTAVRTELTVMECHRDEAWRASRDVDDWLGMLIHAGLQSIDGGLRDWRIGGGGFMEHLCRGTAYAIEHDL